MEEVADEHSQILAPIAQRGQGQGEACHPREEIGAEPVLGRQHLQIVVGGRDHSHVHSDGSARAEGKHLAVLEHAQQQGLRGQGEISDLVEEESASFRCADQPEAVVPCPGFLSVPEQLSLHEGQGERAAVHRLEGPKPAGQRVQGGRDSLLAGAALTKDQHRNRALGERLHVAEGCFQ